jgi:Uma2 family endonuclease
MHAALEQIMGSPRLGLYVRDLNDAWEREQAGRRQFREGLAADSKAEFINGKVIVHSPARERHNVATLCLSTLLHAHVAARGLGVVRVEKALVALTRNDYEPDVCFWGKAKAARILPDQLVYEAPDFVCEILSESTEGRDRGVKFEDYAAHGVGEYWIIEPHMRTIEQYVLRDARYELSALVTRGDITSTQVAGFRVPIDALFNEAANLAALRRLLGEAPAGA